MPYTPSSSLTALDNAVASLTTERDAAAAGGFPAIAAVLDQARARVQAGRDRLAGTVQTSSWTADRAVTALTAQSVPARVDNGRAIVELSSGGRLIVTAWATARPADPRPGYAIAVVGPHGETATIVRAATDDALGATAARLYS